MGDYAQPPEGKFDGSRSSSTPASNLWNNPRKRPRSYDPAAQLETTVDEDILRQADKATGLQSAKRMRVEEWPLKNSDNVAESDTFSPPVHRTSPSPRRKRNSASSIRPSRFVEGSMNDRISQQPPSLYTREEAAMEQYASANMEDVDMVYDAGIESNKPSGMFRFGKAIAHAFNSVNVWQGLNGIWKEKEKENHANPERDVLKARAELKYAELKKNGYKGTQNAPTRPESHDVPAIKYEDTESSRRSSFRDSGVDVDEYRSSSDRKDRVEHNVSTESLMPPQPLTIGRRSASPFSDASSGHRSSIRFHKPSLEGLKRVKSQIHLPSIKKQPEDAPSVPSTETDDAAGPPLRKEASKKDIAKQYRLSKKVSDLQNKLETARRELELSIQEAPPVPDPPARIGRKRFVPGALASLPSERLLTPQTRDNDGTANRSNGPASNAVGVYSTVTTIDDKGDTTGKYNPKVQNENAEAAKQALWNNRASEIAARNVVARQSKALRANTEIDDVPESEAAKGFVSTRNGGSPKKSQESKVPSSHGHSGVRKRPPKVFAKTPCNSPMTSKDEVPLIPAKGAVFDPSKVVQAEIMAMRAISDSRAPFGKAWDDMRNLRKKYPDATEADLVAYMSRQSASKKPTDHTSVSHGDGPPSPFLGRPGSTSPMKPRARASKRGISPPPPSLSSAKKFHRDLGIEKSPAPAERTSPRADGEADAFAPEAPLKPCGEASGAAEAPRAGVDKPLPDIKRDEFEWGDDVF